MLMTSEPNSNNYVQRSEINVLCEDVFFSEHLLFEEAHGFLANYTYIGFGVVFRAYGRYIF